MKFREYLVCEATEQLERWKDYVEGDPMLKAAVKVLKRINSKGYDAYIVGGAVRDLILGDEAHDVDIATNMSIDEISKLYKAIDIGKSRDFGIVTISQDGHRFEVANFREDGKYLDGRRPETVEIVNPPVLPAAPAIFKTEIGASSPMPMRLSSRLVPG